MEQRIIQAQQLDGFRQYLLEEERSAATIEKYLREVGQFVSWLGCAPVSKMRCEPVERASAGAALPPGHRSTGN